MRLPLLASALIAAVLATSAHAQQGHFVGHVTAVWMPDGRHMLLQKPITFVDSQGRSWPVPAGTETDGASIPQAFWWVIGGPFEGRYREAAVVHDYDCDVRRRSWQDTDRMFYDAMLSSGAPAAQAKTMFFAVWSQGPHWDDQTLNNVWLDYPPNGGPSLAQKGPVTVIPSVGPTPVAYNAAKAASLAAHVARSAQATRLGFQSLGTYAEIPGSPSPHRPPEQWFARDSQDVAALIASKNPPFKEVKRLAEDARIKDSATH